MTQLEQYLNQGETLRSGNLLAQKKRGKVYVKTPAFTTRMTMEDFLDLYGNLTFVLYESAPDVNDQKDAEYYQWRALKQ